jgi:hypothetical protein
MCLIPSIFRERATFFYNSYFGTLGSYLRDALHEGGASAPAFRPTPRASASLPPFPPSLLVDSIAFFQSLVLVR